MKASAAHRKTIGKRHSQDFVVGDRLEPFDASVSVTLTDGAGRALSD